MEYVLVVLVLLGIMMLGLGLIFVGDDSED